MDTRIEEIEEWPIIVGIAEDEGVETLVMAPPFAPILFPF